MASYLIDKYKGKYQLKAEIDKRTGDFCRDENGQLENYSDIWIVCNGKGRVFHYGGNKLIYYVPSLGRGHNIIKAIYNDIIGSIENANYETIYKELTDNEIIFNIEETDEEILFQFKANNFDTIANYIKPKTFCASRSPFSNKNIPRSNEAKKYEIPVEDLNEYKEITSVITQNDLSVYRKINNGFLTILSKKKHIAEDILSNEIKLRGWKFKEYIHSQGSDIWNDYLSYIENYLSEVQ